MERVIRPPATLRVVALRLDLTLPWWTPMLRRSSKGVPARGLRTVSCWIGVVGC